MADPILVTILDTFDLVLTFLTYGWPLILVGWLLLLKIRYKRWPLEALIVEKRGSNLIKTNDRAGRYYDDYTGIHGYKLQKSKDTIPILDFDWVMHNVAVPTTIFDKLVNLLRGNIGTIILYRYGSKQYKPVNLKHSRKNKVEYQQVLDEKGKPVYVKIYSPVDPRDKLGGLDFEVVDWDNMNFMVQEQRVSILRRQKKGAFLKSVVVPLVMMAIALVLCIVMIKFGYDYAVNLNPPTQNPSTPTNNNPNPSPNIPIVNDIIPGT